MSVDIEVIHCLPSHKYNVSELQLSHTLAFDGSSCFWSTADGPFALVSRFFDSFYTMTFTLLEAYANARCGDN
jgi:hypothetical protein